MSESLRKNRIPGSIRELLKLLIERRVTLVLDAEIEPQHVEIEDVIGNLVVVEKDNHFKFISIDCICEVIVCCHELVEALLGSESNENKTTDTSDVSDTCHCEEDVSEIEENENNEVSNIVVRRSSRSRQRHRQMKC